VLEAFSRSLTPAACLLSLILSLISGESLTHPLQIKFSSRANVRLVSGNGDT
jgi:hypothetical protein